MIARATLACARLLVCAAALSAASAGCGGDSKTAKSATAPDGVDLDGDALALLPSQPVALLNVDVKAFYASEGAGAKLARVGEHYSPIGEESGFVASRDLDSIVLGVYSFSGADVAAVARGRFDEAKIDAAAKTRTITKSGAPLVASQYSGRTLYTVGNVGFTVLTSKTVIAGTESGIRRVLERIADKRKTRDIPKWMSETLDTSGAATALAVDLQTQPVANAAIGTFSLNFLKGMRTARFVGNFQDPGFHFAATLTFGDAQQANASADQIRSVDSWTRGLGALFSFIPKLDGLEVNVAEKDVSCKAAIDDRALSKLVDMIPGAAGVH